MRLLGCEMRFGCEVRDLRRVRAVPLDAVAKEQRSVALNEMMANEMMANEMMANEMIVNGMMVNGMMVNERERKRANPGGR
jgi:hypothetical protein